MFYLDASRLIISIGIHGNKLSAKPALRNFAKRFYNPTVAVTAMRLGNGKWENTVFNSGMQPTQIGLGAIRGWD